MTTSEFTIFASIFLAFSILGVSATYDTRTSSKDFITNLPKTLQPTFYDLFLVLFPETESYIGTVNITFNVLDNQTVKDIYLNVDSKYIYIEDVLINNMIYPRLGSTNEENILDVNFTLGISGEDNFIHISFIGKYSTDENGLVRTNYTVGEEVLFKAESQFQTGYASRAFPCMDDPDMKAKFSVEIEHSINYTAITDTEVVSEECEASAVYTKFAVTDEISPDSLYILVTDPGKSEDWSDLPPSVRMCENYEL